MLKLKAICSLCQQHHSDQQAICQACIDLFEPLGPACQHCATPLTDAAFLTCGVCIQKKPTIDAVITAYRFSEPLRTMLHAFKYQEGFHLLSALASLMKRALPHGYETDCLIPTPMHKKRLRQRGFNQAAELATYLSRQYPFKCDLHYLKKIIHTSPQAGLSAMERQRNLIGAFQAKQSPYQRITLIDDLVTTGSTVNEMARVLKQQGATRVDVWCCAKASLTRTIKPKKCS